MSIFNALFTEHPITVLTAAPGLYKKKRFALFFMFDIITLYLLSVFDIDYVLSLQKNDAICQKQFTIIHEYIIN
jgi:hypothetical protein